MTTKILTLEAQWLLKSGVGVELLPGTEITAVFMGDKISGSGGVNQYKASYTVDPLEHGSGKIKIEIISLTKIAGSEEMLAQERNYLQALEKVSEYRLTDEGLVLPYPSPARYLFFTRKW
jgi:heat shock protein HslJ